jgi:hypothetical protein
MSREIKSKQRNVIKNIFNPKFTERSTNILNRIDGAMVNVLSSRLVDRGFEPRSGETKDYAVGMCGFSARD